MALLAHGKVSASTPAADEISSLVQRYEEEQDAQYENTTFDLSTCSFLAWIFAISSDRDPGSEVLREAAWRHRFDWQDILIIAQIFRGPEAKRVLESVSRLYGGEFWRCVNANSYDLFYELCELHVVRDHGTEALLALLSDPRTDLYRPVRLSYERKPLLHLLFARCSSGILRASLAYEDGDPDRFHAVVQRYKQILRTILGREDFDPNAEDGDSPSLTAPQVFVDTRGKCGREQAIAQLGTFIDPGHDVC